VITRNHKLVKHVKGTLARRLPLCFLKVESECVPPLACDLKSYFQSRAGTLPHANSKGNTFPRESRSVRDEANEKENGREPLLLLFRIDRWEDRL
jgi:hypothetical protein